MKIDREELLKTLTISAAGVTDREVLEQSNCFIFTEEELITFNGEVMTRVDNPLEITGAVPAADLINLLTKLPDPEITVEDSETELVIKGQRRSAGIVKHAEILLPYDDVPPPKGLRSVPENLMGVLQQATKVCGKEEVQPMTTVVHVTPEKVEACDNFRMFRYELQTGFKRAALIPALGLKPLANITVNKAAYRGGWAHFKTASGHVISIRCDSGDYPNLDPLLAMENPRKVTLPANLADILSRAEVMHEHHDKVVNISITENKIVLKASKDTGWFREWKKIKYTGEPLRFDVNPQFLQQMLEKTRKVEICENRMKLETGEASFVVSLEVVE